jgi:FolB domain-containing protein
MDKIFITDLLLRGYIGFQPWETEKKQDILVNLTLFTDMRRAGNSDHVADALDYKRITKAVIAYVENENTHHALQEALATSIARICIEHGAERVIVRTEKPGALRFAQSVGVEIERTRADFT